VSFNKICTGYLPFVANDAVGGHYVINKSTPDLPDEFQKYNNLFRKYKINYSQTSLIRTSFNPDIFKNNAEPK